MPRGHAKTIPNGKGMDVLIERMHITFLVFCLRVTSACGGEGGGERRGATGLWQRSGLMMVVVVAVMLLTRGAHTSGLMASPHPSHISILFHLYT